VASASHGNSSAWRLEAQAKSLVALVPSVPGTVDVRIPEIPGDPRGAVFRSPRNVRCLKYFSDLPSLSESSSTRPCFQSGASARLRSTTNATVPCSRRRLAFADNVRARLSHDAMITSATGLVCRQIARRCGGIFLQVVRFPVLCVLFLSPVSSCVSFCPLLVLFIPFIPLFLLLLFCSCVSFLLSFCSLSFFALPFSIFALFVQTDQ